MYKKFLRGFINRRQYITYKNKLTALIRIRKKTYYDNFINDHKKDLRKVWQHINSLLGQNLKSNNLGIDTTKNIRKSNRFLCYLFGNYCHSFFLSPTSSEKIHTVIKSLENKNSVGFDNIKYVYYKIYILYHLLAPL